MNRFAFGIFTVSLALATSSASAFAACSAPTTPAVPASFATQAEATASHLAITDFLTGVDAYKQCVKDERASLGTGITSEQASGYDSMVSSINSEMTLVVEAFNAAMTTLP